MEPVQYCTGCNSQTVLSYAHQEQVIVIDDPQLANTKYGSRGRLRPKLRDLYPG